MAAEASAPTVLVVDDDPLLTSLYAAWLTPEYEVVTANSGAEALDRVSAAVDVALLDRHLPDRSGDDLLCRLREQSLDVRVAMVTAVEPDLGVAGLAFDDYLVKPVDEAALCDAVSALCDRRRYDDALCEFFALARRKALLEATLDPDELVAAPEYQSLLDEYEAVRAETSHLRDELLTEGVVFTYD